MFKVILTILIDLAEWNDIIDIVVKVIGLPTAVAGVIALIIRLKNLQKEKRQEAFKKRLAKIEKVRSTSTAENKEKYKEIYKEKLSPSYGLVIDKNWVVYDDKVKINSIDDLIPLSDIKTEVEEVKNEIKIPSLKIYPNHNKFSRNKEEQTFVYNFLKYNENNTHLFNGKLYAAKEVKKDQNKIKLIVHRTDYYSFLNTCRALELLYETKEKQSKFDLDILDLTNRYAGVGVNALTIIKNVRKRTDPSKKRNYFLIHERSDKVMESPNKIHVVPAGSYQPITSIDRMMGIKDDSAAFNRDMANTVYREFCEEILNTNHMSEINSHKLLIESTDYQFCKRFLKTYYLGLGLEPYNTKMEVLALAVIDIDEILTEKDSELITKFIDEHKIINNTIKSLKDGEKFEDKINLDLISSIIKNEEEVKEYIYHEGVIKLEKLSKAMFEQYYSDNHTTPSAKEIFGFLYEHFDEIFK